MTESHGGHLCPAETRSAVLQNLPGSAQEVTLRKARTDTFLPPSFIYVSIPPVGIVVSQTSFCTSKILPVCTFQDHIAVCWVSESIKLTLNIPSLFCLVMESTFLTLWEEGCRFVFFCRTAAEFTSALNEAPHLETAYLRFASGLA